MNDLPHLTVAAVVENQGRFLLVEEEADGLLVWNQPAGHLEVDEELLAGVVREAREETGLEFRPASIVGIYRWRSPRNGITYVRVAFAGTCDGSDARPLDPQILRAVWVTVEEMVANRERLRSPIVLRCVEDYLAGRRYPLELATEL